MAIAKQNTEILDQIRETGSAEYKANVPEAIGNGENVLAVLDQYPTNRNEFLKALTDKVIMSLFYSKVFSNPLAMLHRGKLEFGASIEQIFVEMAEKVDFEAHFKNEAGVLNTNGEQDLINQAESKIHTLYITRNFKYKYKVSISEPRLKTAFHNASGLTTLVAQLMNSLVSAAYRDEFKDMKQIVIDAAAGKTFGATVADRYVQGSQIIKLGADPKATDILKSLRATGGRMKLPSSKFNAAGVEQWNMREDAVLLVEPEFLAEIDVDGLAQLFNMEKGQPMINIIEVDELPSSVIPRGANEGTAGTAVDGCCAVLFDKDFLQSYDTILETRNFENGDKLMINTFLHKQGIMARCDFANCVFFCKA